MSSQGVTWGLCGQTLSVDVPVTVLVKDLKDLVAAKLRESVQIFKIYN